MPSSPEAWVPADLTAGTPAAPRPGLAFVATAPAAAALAPFELAGPSAVPEAVLAPARRAAEAAGYAAGWARGVAAARSAVESSVADDRAAAERDRLAARAEVERTVTALSSAATSFATRQAASLAEAQDAVLAVAWTLVESLVGSVLDDDELRARTVVARVLSSASAAPVTVRLHPADAARVAGLPADVTVVADPALAPGDAVLDGDVGTIDAGLAAGLARVRGVLAR